MKSLNEILEIVCDRMNVTPEQVLSKQRSNRRALHAKKIFCYLQRVLYKTRVVDIGNFLGIRHDVVTYHYQDIKTWVKIYPWWREICDNIEYEIIRK